MKIPRPIESKEEARMFAYFLMMERSRHLADIYAINNDLLKLVHKWGIEMPIPKDGEWVEV